jgi:outer membrane protein OmpA-like peptidoglycan-associated protein
MLKSVFAVGTLLVSSAVMAREPTTQLADACGLGRPGYCYDGRDITDRSPGDDRRDITPRMPDDRRDITVRVPDDQRDITPRVSDDRRDITLRVPDDQRDITPRVPDDQRDITYRHNLDDTTDRTVWCASPPMVIQAPSFMVFFDWDRSDLSARALDTIKQAANAYKTKGGASVMSTGHTDTSGPDAYNMALSLRRANAVKNALVREGVQASDISVVGRGEAQPLVPTADGVREAQNRRVEIVIREDN